MSRGLIRATWPIPIALALVTIFGLVVALTGDGWRDAASWLALGIPIAAIAWAMRARRQ